MKTFKNDSPRTVARLLMVLTLPVLMLFISGCVSSRATVKSSGPVGGQPPPVLTADYLMDIVAFGLNDASLVRHAGISGEGMEVGVEIEIDRPAGWGDGSFEGALSSLAQKTLPVLFEYPEISHVVITVYGVAQGVRSDEIASRLAVDRQAAEGIDWSMLGPMTMSSMVSEYYIHPQILKKSDSSRAGIAGW